MLHCMLAQDPAAQTAACMQPCAWHQDEAYLAQELHGVLSDKCLLAALIHGVRSERLEREANSKCCAWVAGVILNKQDQPLQLQENFRFKKNPCRYKICCTDS